MKTDVKNLSVDEQVKVQVNCLKGIKIVKGQSKPHWSAKNCTELGYNLVCPGRFS